MSLESKLKEENAALKQKLFEAELARYKVSDDKVKEALVFVYLNEEDQEEHTMFHYLAAALTERVSSMPNLPGGPVFYRGSKEQNPCSPPWGEPLWFSTQPSTK